MKTLVIETATAACSIALIESGKVVAATHEIVGRGHAERLVPMIAELIEGGTTPKAILVDCGPGSFTGIRVGLAAARALGFGWGTSVQGFSSLALIAAAVEGEGPIAVALPGGHGELFVQAFVRDPLTEAGPLRSLPPEEAAAAFAEEHVFGAGATMLVAARGSGVAHEGVPNAADAVYLPAAFATLPPAPLYGRAPDAKVPG